MAGEIKIESTRQEIEMLKKRIAELESPEAANEIIKEHTEKSPEKILTEEYRLAPEEIKKQAERIADLRTEEEPHQKQILELLRLAQEKGVLNAVSIAKKLNSPHLEDDFHAALIKYFKNA
ncbi:MAG: hypothetical protein NTX55_00050 [Candidatus Parcubacteria bacterium]|nr:hypothetical protein [Candidatus Parcubacteria bacterium]